MARRRFMPALRGLIPQLSTPGQGAETKAVTLQTWTSSSWTSVYGTEGRADQWDMNTVISDGYERVVWVWKCVEKIAADGRGCRSPRRQPRQGRRERLDAHPLLRCMNRRANPMETGRQFRKRGFALYLLSKKGAFVEVTKTNGGSISRLDLLHPDRVRIVPSQRGDYLSHFEFTRADGLVREIDPARVRWIRNPHHGSALGVTPLEATGSRRLTCWHAWPTWLRAQGREAGRDRRYRHRRPVGADAPRIETKVRTGCQSAEHHRRHRPRRHRRRHLRPPRDMACRPRRRPPKNEILAAFGITAIPPQQRLRAHLHNAEQENFTCWTEVYLSTSTRGRRLRTGPGRRLRPFIDTSSIGALELPRRKRRARREVAAGLRSSTSTGPWPTGPVGNPQTAPWVSPARPGHRPAGPGPSAWRATRPPQHPVGRPGVPRWTSSTQPGKVSAGRNRPGPPRGSLPPPVAPGNQRRPGLLSQVTRLVLSTRHVPVPRQPVTARPRPWCGPRWNARPSSRSRPPSSTTPVKPSGPGPRPRPRRHWTRCSPGNSGSSRHGPGHRRPGAAPGSGSRPGPNRQGRSRWTPRGSSTRNGGRRRPRTRSRRSPLRPLSPPASFVGCVRWCRGRRAGRGRGGEGRRRGRVPGRRSGSGSGPGLVEAAPGTHRCRGRHRGHHRPCGGRRPRRTRPARPRVRRLGGDLPRPGCRQRCAGRREQDPHPRGRQATRRCDRAELDHQGRREGPGKPPGGRRAVPAAR